MDTSAIMKAVMNEDTIKSISKMAGIDAKDANKVVQDMLPALINGAAKQNKNKDTASAFLDAVLAHGAKDSSDMSKFIKNIDMEDGAKIVGHLLGGDASAKTAAAAKKSGLGNKEVDKIVAMLAPIVMNQLGASAKNSSKNDKDALGDILGTLVKNVDMDDVMKMAKNVDVDDVMKLAKGFLKK